ncbi:TrbG/VirB9 family P-type conjugative transfer protein [Massilia putida]|uniref:TrbG/VirB9 family P-type conjugative transfer protein n=1 Tax=Massilia putida TaxID=1141883 RepID=UPI0009531D61|nr:TrbG/VirB9 family P-type conjugative transfer protein [Massilia putida]
MNAKLNTAVLLNAACLLTCTAAMAATVDPRIHIEQYDPNRVVEIYTATNNPTLIQFEDDEQVVDTPKGMIGFGDAKAWSVGPRGSNIMLKPKVTQPDTKALVVTNKRTYAFEIMSVPKKSRIQPTLIVRFTYPDTKAKLARAEADRQDVIARRLQQTSGKDGTTRTRNRQYMKRGDESLSPSLVEDDGRFTYFRFDSTRELPVVYKLLPDGREALTNFHMDPDTGTMVVHETASNFILRYGKAVMAIRNDGWNPDGALNLTGSTLPRTVRMDKEAQ